MIRQLRSLLRPGMRDFMSGFSWPRIGFTHALPRAIFVAVFFAVPLCAQTEAGDSLRVPEAGTAASASPPAAVKKNPTGAAFRSLAIPGWGQYYNGQKIKAALAMAAEAAEIGTAIYWNGRARGASDPEEQFLYRDYRNQALWILAATILVSMLDAYVDAHLYDFDESPSLDQGNAGTRQPEELRFGLRLQIRL